jgi:hypothetical protein
VEQKPFSYLAFSITSTLYIAEQIEINQILYNEKKKSITPKLNTTTAICGNDISSSMLVQHLP